MVSEIERRVKILEYLRENSLEKKPKKINKSDVMRHLEPISRLKTTHGTIINLIHEGKIKMIKDKPYSQTHYLTINANNPFNKIYNSLLEIENIIDSMAHLANVSRKLTEYDKGDEDEENKAGYLLRTLYRDVFQLPVEGLLHILIVIVTEARLSPNDSEIFYKKIGELLQKEPRQWGHADLRDRIDFILNNNIPAIELLIKKHENDFKKYESIYNKYNLDLRLQDDLLQITRNVKTKFLS